jgi:hypothetical protein
MLHKKRMPAHFGHVVPELSLICFQSTKGAVRFFALDE